MDERAAWIEVQQELSAASRNEHWWKVLPQERRLILGLTEYRKQCQLARQRVKIADRRCRELFRTKRNNHKDQGYAKLG